MSKQAPKAGPVTVKERIHSLDILRGFAILGILIMNIQAFSMIYAAYANPTAYGDLTGINKWVWIMSHVLANLKFMTIFAIMFGAGIILLTSRVEAKKGSPAKIHYRRTFWLLVIGLMHAHLLWWGDILVPYAQCAFILFLFRKLKPKTLLIMGLILLMIGTSIYVMGGLSLPQWPQEARDNQLKNWKPDLDAVNAELEAYRGSWLEQMKYRVPASLIFETFVFLIWGIWRIGGVMLIGMALYKWGVLSAERSKQFYRRLMAIGLPLGWLIASIGVIQDFAHGWSLEYSMLFGVVYNYWGSILVSLGYIAGVMLFSLKYKSTWLANSLAAVGRTAFSNYLLQTVICTTLFYGHGFGLFGSVDRWGQALIIPAIWIFQLVISPIWLKHFHFGPAEWVWRSLTYMKAQPFRIKE